MYLLLCYSLSPSLLPDDILATGQSTYEPLVTELKQSPQTRSAAAKLNRQQQQQHTTHYYTQIYYYYYYY